MTLSLTRRWLTERSTIGTLDVDGARLCFTLEDQSRALSLEMALDELLRRKVPGRTAIPAGKYRVGLTPSDRARRGGLWSPREDHMLPLLLDVPGFEGVRIHAGNTDANTEGCILVGFGRHEDAISSSRPALIALMAKLDAAAREGDPCWIEITEEPA